MLLIITITNYLMWKKNCLTGQPVSMPIAKGWSRWYFELQTYKLVYQSRTFLKELIVRHKLKQRRPNSLCYIDLDLLLHLLSLSFFLTKSIIFLLFRHIPIRDLLRFYKRSTYTFFSLFNVTFVKYTTIFFELGFGGEGREIFVFSPKLRTL
jgi:hypothetical protein